MATGQVRYTEEEAKARGTPTGSSTSGRTGSTSTTEGSSEVNREGTSSSSTQNMDPKQLAALNFLIQQLSTGGTPNMREDRAFRTGEIGTLRNQRAGYSKEAAFADAKGLMAQTMRQALEKLLPSINTGALGAGSSQSSMRALLTQRAGENAAEAASARGLDAAVNYGNVSNNMSSILERLIAQQDPTTAALINALAVAKGSTVNTSGSTSERSTGTNTSTVFNTGMAEEEKFIRYEDLPRGSVSSGPNQLPEFAAQAPVGTGVGSTNDLLNQLYGDRQAFQGYKF